MPVEEKEYVYIILISHVSSNISKRGWFKQLEGVRRRMYNKNINNLSYVD